MEADKGGEAGGIVAVRFKNQSVILRVGIGTLVAVGYMGEDERMLVRSNNKEIDGRIGAELREQVY